MKMRRGPVTKGGSTPTSPSTSPQPMTRAPTLRDFFFLNWRKVYRTTLILLLVHFLHDKHMVRRQGTSADTCAFNPADEPDPSGLLNMPSIENTVQDVAIQLQEATTRSDLSLETQVEGQGALTQPTDAKLLKHHVTFIEDDNKNVVIFAADVLSDATYTLRSSIEDVLFLHYFTFDMLSLYIALIGFVIYMAARPLDNVLQSFFYDPVQHKNIHQLPDLINRIGKRGIKWYRNICIVSAIWPIAHEISRETALMFVQGSMWMSLVKRGMKMFADKKKYKGALRPPNEHFLRGIYYGGFPSGHMSQSGYAITLTLLSYTGSLHDQLIIGFLAVHFVFAMFWLVTSNRHYLSQTVAGFSLGVIYGFAAFKIIMGGPWM